jgi:hypothetical protein
MKISIVAPESIRKNLLNTSVSKQGFSFSRTSRFKQPLA